jgi:uncharacterized protein (TIGR00255 family)
MTGYGEASAQTDGVHYFVEVRSLNNKYFKASIRLPDSLQGLEAELESRLRQRLSRGTITLNASCTDASASAAHEINRQALDRYIAQLKDLSTGSDIKIDLGALLALPGVLQPPADNEDRLDRARGAMLPLVDQAVNGLLAMREREGRLIVDDLEQHRLFIAERLRQIADRAPAVVADYEKRLKTRIEAMLQGAEARVDAVDLVREIAVYAERTDIAEEISRLGGHLEQFATLLSGKDDRAIGRTLDFLAQEMLRESNTIASKSPDAGISRQIVEVKGAIDRIKEQAQNVE